LSTKYGDYHEENVKMANTVSFIKKVRALKENLMQFIKMEEL
jgi:hypothetical protein